MMSNVLKSSFVVRVVMIVVVVTVRVVGILLVLIHDRYSHVGSHLTRHGTFRHPHMWTSE
jgi:hypothetical protein